MSPQQIAEQANCIRSGFGNGRDFDEPQELVFSEDDAIPDEEVCPDCGSPMIDGECENCTKPTATDLDDDCPYCNGVAENAYECVCQHRRSARYRMSRRHNLDPDEV